MLRTEPNQPSSRREGCRLSWACEDVARPLQMGKTKEDQDEDSLTCEEEVDACLTRCTDEYGGTMMSDS